MGQRALLLKTSHIFNAIRVDSFSVTQESNDSLRESDPINTKYYIPLLFICSFSKYSLGRDFMPGYWCTMVNKTDLVPALRRLESCNQSY